MYDLLLQWGLESLRQVTFTKSDQELAVMLEAIRAKNMLVLERFRYGWASCQAVVDLAVSVEEALPSFVKEARETDGSLQATKNFMGDLKAQFHPKFYRKLAKIRCQFDATNDLLAAYSDVFADVLHFGTIGEIAKHKELRASSDLVRLYRGLWSFYSRVMTALVRITSSDLRFWLTDQPYILTAREHADTDWREAKQYLMEPEGRGIRYCLSLEKGDGLDRFWKSIEKARTTDGKAPNPELHRTPTALSRGRRR